MNYAEWLRNLAERWKPEEDESIYLNLIADKLDQPAIVLEPDPHYVCPVCRAIGGNHGYPCEVRTRMYFL